MRSQRRPTATVTLDVVTATKDELGNFTENSVPTTIDGAIFEPEHITEGDGNDQARVIQPAVFNLPGVYQLDADDLIQVGDETWQVVGGSAVWGDRTKVPVTQVRGQ